MGRPEENVGGSQKSEPSKFIKIIDADEVPSCRSRSPFTITTSQAYYPEPRPQSQKFTKTIGGSRIPTGGMGRQEGSFGSKMAEYDKLEVGAAGVYVEGNTGEEPGAEESGWIIKKPAGLIERDAYDELAGVGSSGGDMNKREDADAGGDVKITEQDVGIIFAEELAYDLQSVAEKLDMKIGNGIEDEVFEAESVTVWPKQGVIPRVSPPLVYDAGLWLQSQWEGGCVFSVHDSRLADDWLNDHHEHKCLVNLRANGIGGPLPSMLSVDVPALTIFGSMSPQTIKIADELAKLSDFPVIIRPTTDDPSTLVKYHQSSNPEGESSGSQTHGKINTMREHGGSRHGMSTQCSKRLPDRDDHPDDHPEDNDGGRDPPDSSALYAEMHHREITHDTEIHLKILVDGKDRGDFLRLQTSVKFYPIPNEKEVSENCKPEIEANIRLKMRGSPSVEIDSAAGSLGFITDNRSYLRFEEFVPLGNEKPLTRGTRIEKTQRTNTFNLTAGLSGGKPIVTGAFTRTDVDGAENQAEDVTPAPPWVVEEEATEQISSCYRTLNAKIYRSSNPHQNGYLDAKYGMSVEVACPIREYTSKVSFTYRHQIHCWVAVKSKARRRGIIVVAANYIPDICTKRKLWIQEYPKLNLVQDRPEGKTPEAKLVPTFEQTSPAIFSFATATAPEALTQIPESSWRPKLPKFQKSQKEAGQDIPVHTHVCRGWDHTNLEWQKVVWPKLDRNLKSLREESTEAWRLDWQGHRAKTTMLLGPEAST